MRRAFFVIGCESSGTRMMVESLVSAGVFGDNEHEQMLDNLNFHNRPDLIVFRRSVPHEDRWPPLNALYNLIAAAGYEVVPFIMWRQEKYLVLSQTERGHVLSKDKAKEHINRAYNHIVKFAQGKKHELVQYEHFVTDVEYRSELFWEYGLTKPTIEFYNANEAYE